MHDGKSSQENLVVGTAESCCYLIICFYPVAGPEEDSGDPGPGEEAAAAAAAQARAWSPTSTAPQEVELQPTWRNGD